MQVLKDDASKLLLYRLKDGDETAFRLIYDTHSLRLYANLFRLVRSEDIAKEILQDVFMKVWSYREQIDPERSFRAFLFKIGENLVYNYFRKVSRDKNLLADFIENNAGYYTHIEEALFHKEIEGILNKAIEDLSPQRKQVFTLCKLEGKSYKEVSEMLGISVSTISDHIVKATRTIKEHLVLHEDIAISVIALMVFFTS